MAILTAAPAPDTHTASRPPLLVFAEKHADLLLLLALSAIAALPRLWALGDIPQGIHGDEAQVGMDAWRVLEDGWIGVYTPAALGQPAGHAYYAAPFIEILGSSAFSVRLPFALAGIAAVPLAYTLFRLQADRTVAVIAALLLALSLWHIHFSRTAHWPITYPTVELAVLVFWTLAIQRGGPHWFALAGATLGLGLYTYNIYPVFVIAFTVWVVLYTLQNKRGAAFKPWAANVALAAAIAFLYGIPLFVYILTPSNEYFDHYNQYYETYSILQTPAYVQGGFTDKVEIIFDQVKIWIGAYAWEGVPDLIDASSPDYRPMLDILTVGLFVAGVGYAASNWRKTPHLLALTLLAIMPLTSVLQTNATYRGVLGLSPFVAFFAALPLAWVWRKATAQAKDLYRGAGYALVIVAITVIGYTNLHAYFGPWKDSLLFPWVYAQEISEASEYLDTLDTEPYVYFYSSRWRFDYETRQYLAPGFEGEDRSQRFGRRQDDVIDRSRDSVFILLDPYLDRLEGIKRLYPGGTEYVGRDGDDVFFIAYHVPADPAFSTSAR